MGHSEYQLLNVIDQQARLAGSRPADQGLTDRNCRAGERAAIVID